jgi:hypothetical protein
VHQEPLQRGGEIPIRPTLPQFNKPGCRQMKQPRRKD